MSINSVIAAYGPSVNSAYGRTEKVRSGVVGTDRPAAPKGEKVEISSASRGMRTVQNALGSLPEVRSSVVSDIERLIENNDYPLESKIDGTVDKMFAAGVFA